MVILLYMRGSGAADLFKIQECLFILKSQHIFY